MARLSTDEYIKRHAFLAWAWRDCQTLYAIISVPNQWRVHAYYQPSKALSLQELLEHRRTITRHEPSLPHRAGKLYSRLRRSYEAALPYTDGRLEELSHDLKLLVPCDPVERHKGKRVRVVAIARPKLDLKKLVQLLSREGLEPGHTG